ncbi:MAG: hypothetical protein APR54_02770 [Candidatus Cloacimonas sp. SDB]|nr:MAG: hypothetical protein APR54_02770 [Candidatus Cloacimonas sp. SDB]
MSISNLFKSVWLLFLLFQLSPIICQNNVEMLFELEGETPEAKFGLCMASLDFNGDGFDDLVISSPYWTNGDVSGKLYCYIGGVDFNNEPEFTIIGDSLASALGSSMSNLGDVNNDGFEDLGYKQYFSDVHIAYILFGNAEFELLPDYEFVFPVEHSLDTIKYISRLGDINGDEFDDVGILFSNFIEDTVEYYLVFGSDNELEINYLNSFGVRGSAGFKGIGDVNADGFDDFCIGYHIYNRFLATNKLIFGGETIDTTNAITLFEEPLCEYPTGLPCGDINNDGYDDFLGYLGPVEYLWLGQQNITSQYDLILEFGQAGSGYASGMDYGDLNNDGYDDIVIGASNHAWDIGIAYIYLGNANPNNSVDFEIEVPPGIVGQQFGYSIVTGRFNGDEYIDFAISAPLNTINEPGNVYVYVGNGELEDLVNSEENTIYLETSLLNIYPNPYKLSDSLRNSQITFEILSNEFEDYEVEIYNLKGQKLYGFNIDLSRSKDNKIQWHVKDIPTGVYLINLLNNGVVLETKKMTIMK